MNEPDLSYWRGHIILKEKKLKEKLWHVGYEGDKGQESDIISASKWLIIKVGGFIYSYIY